MKNAKGFTIDLLDYLNQQSEHLRSLQNIAVSVSIEERIKHSIMALEALYNVIKNNTGVEIQCIGHFPLIFGLLAVPHKLIQKKALDVTSSVTRNHECVNDIAACEILGHLLLILYTLPEQQLQTLDILCALMSTTKIVKEALSKGISPRLPSFIY